MIRLAKLLKEEKEFIIWGVPPGERDEVVAYTKAKSMPEAKKVMDILKQKYGLTKLRVQVIDLSQEFDLKKAFGGTVKESVNEDIVTAGLAFLTSLAIRFLLPSVFDGLMATLYDIRNFVSPPKYIKFLKQLENNDEFNRQFMDLVKERGGMEKFANRMYSNQVALGKLPALRTALEKFYKEEGLDKEQSKSVEKSILYAIKEQIKLNWPKVLDMLKKKYPEQEAEAWLKPASPLLEKRKR
jgi:hypothetical protein